MPSTVNPDEDLSTMVLWSSATAMRMFSEAEAPTVTQNTVSRTALSDLPKVFAGILEEPEIRSHYPLFSVSFS
jgi:hypothetical protein